MRMGSGSILRRLLFSFSLVSVPLVLGLLLILYLVDDFSRLSRSTMESLARVLESGDGLVESVLELERSAREYLLLGEQPFFQQLQENHKEIHVHLQSLSRINLNDGLDEMVAVAAQMESDLFSAITEDEKSPGDATRDAIRDLAELRDLSRRIYTQSSSELREEIARLQRSGETNVKVVGLLVIGLFLFTFLLAVGLTVRLSRPIETIDAAIKRMGRGDFKESIEVDGPRDLKALACRLEWLRQRLQEIEKEKETFLLHMSHELKSPVTSLHEGVGLLNEQLAGPLNSKQQEIARILFENVHYLRTLIDNYVNYHALALPARQAVNRRFRLDELADRVIGAIRQTGRHKALSFDVSLQEIDIVGDPERMRLVLTNLLSNAVKFSPAGSTVSLRIAERPEGAVMEVADSGPGIPKDEKEKVFQPFFQGVASFREHIQGNGLGLSIVREYVNQFGGRISVIDRDPGTLFKVVIPKAPVKVVIPEAPDMSAAA
jgi:two-component system sensor histidine kinase GlrK